jgi:hypothetical protein
MSNNIDNRNQPIINVYVFQDGENCFIPKKEISRDKLTGKMLYNGKHTRFTNKNMDYIAELIKQNVIRECFDILEKNEHNRNTPFSNYQNINLKNIDYRKVNTLYYFVLQKYNNHRNNYYPSYKTTDSISNSLFNINAHTKGVDLKINDLIDATIKVINKDVPTLFIIISGDGDFRNSIQNAYQAGCECCVLYNSDTKLSDNFYAFIKDCGFSRNSWWNVLDKCISDNNFNNFNKLNINNNNNNNQENQINFTGFKNINYEIRNIDPITTSDKKENSKNTEDKKEELVKKLVKIEEFKNSEPVKKLVKTEEFKNSEPVKKIIKTEEKKEEPLKKLVKTEESKNSEPVKKVIKTEESKNPEPVKKLVKTEEFKNSESVKKVIKTEESKNPEPVKKLVKTEEFKNSEPVKKLVKTEDKKDKPVKKVIKTEDKKDEPVKKVIKTEESKNPEPVKKVIKTEEKKEEPVKKVIKTEEKKVETLKKLVKTEESKNLEPLKKLR